MTSEVCIGRGFTPVAVCRREVSYSCSIAGRGVIGNARSTITTAPLTSCAIFPVNVVLVRYPPYLDASDSPGVNKMIGEPGPPQCSAFHHTRWPNVPRRGRSWSSSWLKVKLPVEFVTRAEKAGGIGTTGGTRRGLVAEAGVRRARSPRLRAAESCIVAVARGLKGGEETEGNQESSSKQRACWT